MGSLPSVLRGNEPPRPEKEENNIRVQTRKEYELRKQKNPSESFGTFLKEKGNEKKDILRRIRFYRENEESIRDPAERKKILVELAVLEELAGDISGAVRSYAEAADLLSPQDLRLKFREYALRFERGEDISEPVRLARQKARDPEEKRLFLTLEIDLLLRQNKIGEARKLLLRSLRDKSPELDSRGYYLYRKILRAENSKELSEQLTRVIREKFPLSLEEGLIRKTISPFSEPSLFFRPSSD